MARKTKKRQASAERIREVWQEKKSVAAVARRISYSYVGAARALYRLGLFASKTALSK